MDDPDRDAYHASLWALVCAAACVWVLLAVSPGRCAQPCQRAEPLVDGQAAPCSGLLVPESEALAAALCVAADLPACRVELRASLASAGAERLASDAIRRADAAEIAALRGVIATLDRPPVRPWYSEPWVVATATAIAVVAIAVPVTLAVAR